LPCIPTRSQRVFFFNLEGERLGADELALQVEFQESSIRVEDAREKKKQEKPVVPVNKKHKRTLQDLKKEIEMVQLLAI